MVFGVAGCTDAENGGEGDLTRPLMDVDKVDDGEGIKQVASASTQPLRRNSRRNAKDVKLTTVPRRKTGPVRRSTKGGWTKEEDEILRKLVKEYKEKNWKKIAASLPGRKDVQCLHRWQKVLNPHLVKGAWLKEEDERMLQLVKIFGTKKWSLIASSLQGRIGKQCRERWHNNLNPAIKKGKWTPEEESDLINAQQKYGNKWAKISKIITGRTENAIKNHWNCSVKKRSGLNKFSADSKRKTGVTLNDKVDEDETTKTPVFSDTADGMDPKGLSARENLDTSMQQTDSNASIQNTPFKPKASEDIGCSKFDGRSPLTGGLKLLDLSSNDITESIMMCAEQGDSGKANASDNFFEATTIESEFITPADKEKEIPWLPLFSSIERSQRNTRSTPLERSSDNETPAQRLQPLDVSDMERHAKNPRLAKSETHSPRDITTTASPSLAPSSCSSSCIFLSVLKRRGKGCNTPSIYKRSLESRTPKDPAAVCGDNIDTTLRLAPCQSGDHCDQTNIRSTNISSSSTKPIERRLEYDFDRERDESNALFSN